jgi:hypothetical protein
MKTYLTLAAVALLAVVAPLSAAELRGQYVEARTCDVWTAACFANAEMNLTGKHAVMAWKFDSGDVQGVALDGLSVVAVVEASDTLGLQQNAPTKAVLLVDQKASKSQREALITVARKLGGSLLQNVVGVDVTPIQLQIDCCKEGGCARLDAGQARLETRCLHPEHHKICGHEDNFYAPLAKGVNVKAAMVTEHSYTGKAFNKTWKDAERRGAYLGSFRLGN